MSWQTINHELMKKMIAELERCPGIPQPLQELWVYKNIYEVMDTVRRDAEKTIIDELYDLLEKIEAHCGEYPQSFFAEEIADILERAKPQPPSEPSQAGEGLC